MKQDQNRPLRAFALVGTIGVEMATSVIFGFWAGSAIDKWLKTEPWFMLIGLLFGLALGVYGLYLLVRQFFGE
ncbi:AtpZ/AtpI family protein [Aneurinibacillus uraniidurans]|uniref:AtpZ/AtpI family protein n=1 Tax=Aneurinibacillus uraniidurans TaxID=2966586 RepID=UPI00234B0398|nr:AtpZ/AtpI family protein [Aneurinibacillus sp. B1]WCN38055.1 AtpZ/AtpI family protein [Aneurinibacillus sp. B1]